jgi:hypothetical protein
MGKKSLFEPTIAPEEEIKAPAPEKVRDDKETTTARTPKPPEPEATAAKAETPPVEAVEPAPVQETPPAAVKQEVPPPVKTQPTSSPGDIPPFENEPLIDTRTLMTGAVVLCGLILLIFVGSVMNADNYYVKQNMGAVEIWKGDFSPGGKERVLILHGTHWRKPYKKSYTKAEVFPFVAAYYLDKANMLTEAPVSEDLDRILYYLDRVQALYAEEQTAQLDNTISQIRKTIAEVRILQASGEKAAVDLAQKKITAVSRALTDLMAEMTGESKPAPEAAAAGH